MILYFETAMEISPVRSNFVHYRKVTKFKRGYSLKLGDRGYPERLIEADGIAALACAIQMTDNTLPARRQKPF
jgi:hypothetical protein